MRTDFAAAGRHWGRLRALLRGLPDDHEAATLGIAACTQLLTTSWRIGLGLADARALVEEGRTRANAIGDRCAHVRLSMVYGRALLGAGEVAESLESQFENRRAALELDETAVRANAWAVLVDALGHAARFPEALEAADEGLARFPRHIASEDWTVGFSPASLLSLWRGVCLYWMGRIPEGLEELGRCIRLAEEDRTPEMAGYAAFYAAEASYHAHDGDRALGSARQFGEICARLGEPPGLVACGQLALCHRYLATGRAASAVEPARVALALHSRLEKQLAGVSATLLAEALLQSGDLSAAGSAAEDAIALCRRTLRGTYEAIAHGVLARALLRRDGAAARAHAEAAFTNAAALIERTGARTLAPALCEWRAELAAVLGDAATRAEFLRQAQRGYDEIGATGHAARMARELGA